VLARRRYDWVFLDAGDTLFQVVSAEAGLAAAVAEIGYEVLPEQMTAILERATQEALVADHVGPAPDYVISAERARARRERLTTALLQGIGVRAADIEQCKATVGASFVGAAYFSLFPEVRRVLETLRASGYRLGIISNWEPRLELLCRSHGLGDQLAFVLASEAEGFAKPGPHLFRRALELADVAPQRAVHVGDSFEHDVLGASALGIGAVLLDRGEYYPPGQWEPTIRSLDELPAVLAAPPA